MADGILIKSYSLHHRGDHELDFQPIRDTIGVDPEFHGLITLQENTDQRIIYMIIKIINPQGISGDESDTTYHLNIESVVPFETAWLNKVSPGLVFVRYDKIIETFLPFGS